MILHAKSLTGAVIFRYSPREQAVPDTPGAASLTSKVTIRLIGPMVSQLSFITHALCPLFNLMDLRATSSFSTAIGSQKKTNTT